MGSSSDEHHRSTRSALAANARRRAGPNPSPDSVNEINVALPNRKVQSVEEIGPGDQGNSQHVTEEKAGGKRSFLDGAFRDVVKYTPHPTVSRDLTIERSGQVRGQ
jgi:hypothetical protein